MPLTHIGLEASGNFGGPACVATHVSEASLVTARHYYTTSPWDKTPANIIRPAAWPPGPKDPCPRDSGRAAAARPT